MNSQILSYIIIIILVVFAVVCWCYIIKKIFFSKNEAPYISTFNRHIELMKQLDIKDGSNLVDLWCGDGKALRFFVTNFKIKKADWYDINRYAIFKGKLINKKEKIKNINLYLWDLTSCNIKNYDYIYLYLRDTQLEIIEDWVRQDKKSTSIIISNSFQFKKHKPFKTIKNKQGIDTIFLYK